LLILCMQPLSTYEGIGLLKVIIGTMPGGSDVILNGGDVNTVIDNLTAVREGEAISRKCARTYFEIAFIDTLYEIEGVSGCGLFHLIYWSAPLHHQVSRILSPTVAGAGWVSVPWFAHIPNDEMKRYKKKQFSQKNVWEQAK
jgi:hypothetical protein